MWLDELSRGVFHRGGLRAGRVAGMPAHIPMFPVIGEGGIQHRGLVWPRHGKEGWYRTSAEIDSSHECLHISTQLQRRRV